MNLETRFDTLWNRFDDFELPEQQNTLCAYAHQFSQWVSALLTDATTKPNLVTINQAKLQLLDKYFEWRAYVPKPHRERTGGRSGHTCIFHVFVDAYQTLKVTELSLTPPLLFLPEPAPPPLPPQIAGIFIGEQDEE